MIIKPDAVKAGKVDEIIEQVINLKHMFIHITVEPLKNGHIGIDHFIHYGKAVLFRRQKLMYCHCLCTERESAL